MLAVKLEKLRFDYGQLVVFEDLNLEIPSGSFNALVGRNGSGKSTLIRMFARLTHPRSGVLKVLGQDTDRETALLLNSIGFVSESINFSNPHLFEEILPVFRTAYKKWSYDLEKTLLEKLQLSGKTSFLELSRGQRMLFCFVLAACHEPKLYLIDEITSVLDPVNRKIVLDHIASEVKKGATAIIATNIVSEVGDYADRVIYLAEKNTAIAGDMNDFCRAFVKFHAPPNISEEQKKHLKAVLVGTQENELVFISKLERRSAIEQAGFQIQKAQALPMEVFIFLSQGEQR